MIHNTLQYQIPYYVALFISKKKKKKFLLYLYSFNEVEEMRIFKPGHCIKVRDLTIQNDNELCLLIVVPVKKKRKT